MVKRLINWFRPQKDLSLVDLLSSSSMQEDLLGMQKMQPPEPDRVRHDANKMVAYSRSQEYKVFAQEVWARILTHLDVIQDPKATVDQINFHRGALNESLEVLRLSHKALLLKEQMEKTQTRKTSLPFSR